MNYLMINIKSYMSYIKYVKTHYRWRRGWDLEAERDLRRLKVFSRGSSALLLVITAVMVALTVVIAIGVGWILADPSGLEEDFGMTWGQSALFGIALVAALVLVTATFAIIFRMMLNISRGHSPFVEDNVRMITILSAIYVVMPVVLTVSACVGESNCALIAIVAAAIFLPSLFVAALLYTLALVFRYGCCLQKESDETL